MKKKFTVATKQKAVDRLNAGEKAHLLAKEFKVSTSGLYQWRIQLLGASKTASTFNKFVLIYLRQGADEISKMLREGTIKRLDKAHIRLLLALAELEDS
jgi:transposase-like protein